MGQEKVSVKKISEEWSFMEKDVQLKSDNETVLDSVVFYNDKGDRVDVHHNPVGGPRFYYNDYYNAWCQSIDHFYIRLDEERYDVKYNPRGLVESTTFINSNGITFLRQFQYNANDYLLSVNETLRYSGSTSWINNNQETYTYDAHENWIGYQEYNFYYNSIGNSYNARVDSKGRIVYSERYGINDNRRYNLMYYIWYYSDGRTPNIAPENNTPIGDNNQGSFDLDVNIPVDSISNGSLVVTLPEGFTLDAANTSLTLDFVGSFELKITKQENNSWLLEIKPKTTRSVSLRADEAKNMLHVAYKVDEKKQQGTYDIIVNSILFETKGGDYIPEPAITIPVVIDRSVDNELIQSPSPVIYINNQTIYIQSEKSEQIAIYAITGSKLYETAIQAGMNTINTVSFSQGIYIVKGSNGWVKKLIAK